MARLERGGFLERQGDVKVVLKPKTRTVNVPTSAIRKFHRQILGKALQSLDEVPVKNRFVLNSVIAIRKDQIEEARAFLDQMRDEFARRFECQSPESNVHALSIVQFPLVENH